MVIMAIDLGDVRTGTAICDSGELLASPLTVITQRNREKLCEQLCQLAQQRGVKLFVVGLPRNMDGSEGSSAQHARDFAAMLAQASGIDAVMQDERGTTITAHHFLNDVNSRGKKRKETVDAVAATIILENHLQYRRNHRDIQS